MTITRFGFCGPLGVASLITDKAADLGGDGGDLLLLRVGAALFLAMGVH